MQTPREVNAVLNVLWEKRFIYTVTLTDTITAAVIYWLDCGVWTPNDIGGVIALWYCCEMERNYQITQYYFDESVTDTTSYKQNSLLGNQREYLPDPGIWDPRGPLY